MQSNLVRKLALLWLAHLSATVAGWYALSALAQGAVDSRSGASSPLDIFQLFIQILCFPIVTPAVRIWAGLGEFSRVSFAGFLCVAAINSAVVVAIVVAVVAAIMRATRARHRRAE